MCVVVQLAVTDGPLWLRRDAEIRIPGDLTRGQMMSLTRLILAELGAVQPPESTMEARCYCGDPLTLHDMPRPAAGWHVPQQRVHMAEVPNGT